MRPITRPLVRRRLPALRTVLLGAAVALTAGGATACVGELPDEAADTSATTSMTTSTSGDASMDVTTGPDTGEPSDVTDGDTGTTSDSATGADTTVATDGADGGDDVVATGDVVVVLTGDDGSPVGGATVAFGTDADAATVVTDDSGQATFEATEPGWLSVDGTSILGERILISIADVRPGERLELRSPRADEVDAQPLGTISVKADVANSVPNASRVTLSNACSVEAGGLLLDVSMQVDTSCATPSGETGLLAYATGSEGSIVAFGVFESIPLGDRLEFFDLRDPPRAVAVRVTNRPSDILTARFNPFLEVGASRVALAQVPMPIDPDTDEIVSTFAVPGDADLPMDYFMSFRYGADMSDNTQILEFDGRLSLESISVDGNRDLLPQIASASADLSASPGVLRYEAGDGIERADAVLHMMEWTGAAGNRRWAVIAAPEAGPEVQLPALPAAFAEQVPPEGVETSVSIVAVDVSYHAGWDTARLRPIELFSNIESTRFDGEFSRATTAFNFLD